MDAAVKLSTATAASPALRKELNLFDAVALVVGTIIGCGRLPHPQLDRHPTACPLGGAAGLGRGRAADGLWRAFAGRAGRDVPRGRRHLHLPAPGLWPRAGVSLRLVAAPD